jgi:hypothetical protein
VPRALAQAPLALNPRQAAAVDEQWRRARDDWDARDVTRGTRTTAGVAAGEGASVGDAQVRPGSADHGGEVADARLARRARRGGQSSQGACGAREGGVGVAAGGAYALCTASL